MKSKRIILNAGEIRVATHIGKCRNQANIDAGVKSQKKSHESEEQIDIDGMLSEIAAAKYFNVYPDFTLEVRSGGHDLIVRGLRVDVKCSRYNGDTPLMTIAINKKADQCDIFVMTKIHRDSEIEVIGFIREVEALVDEFKTDLGYGPTIAIPFARLDTNI
jgi:hypothetical protein